MKNLDKSKIVAKYQIYYYNIIGIYNIYKLRLFRIENSKIIYNNNIYTITIVYHSVTNIF